MSSAGTAIVFFLLVGALQGPASLAAGKPPGVFFFGDSVVDSGNNNALATPAKCNFPPYGRDFAGRRATGRFSNGRIPSDLIASRIKLKEYVPAYLGAELSAGDLLTGVTFASGGSRFDPLTAELVSALTMDDQLSLFKEYKEKVMKSMNAGEKKGGFIISNSLYFIVTGTDDLANTYFTTPFRRIEYDLPSYINFTIQSASRFVRLYATGARKINVVGLPPIGCLPTQRTLAGGPERVCNPIYNQAAIAFNSQLSKEMQILNSTLPRSRIKYMDMYSPLLYLILHPSINGFVEAKRGCCGTGLLEASIFCNSLASFMCEDASKYVFWDGYHPTERAYKILIRTLGKRYRAFLT